jgi:thiol-disulfide isomerase/thioredoxin
MSERTETLAVGSRAPEFLLSAANRDWILSLSGFLSRRALIVEFLRGTWCPNCRRRMSELELMKTEIERAGAQLVYIAAEKSTGVWKPAKFLQSHPVLVIGRERKVDYIYRGDSQTDRAPFQKVIESIRKLSAIG